ncbi:DUF2500 domain-containing protein [Evansella sp. AB-rgal1]|uniref:DUF2500 domain-containing protein n=1 Tax=Evansella sp. AB-rgal1 TaxID=3242696 RepID=UPI00359E48D5
MFMEPNFLGTIFPLFFMLVIGLILFQVIRGIGEWSNNNKQPVLTVNAKIVSKRTKISRHSHASGNGHHHHSTSTTYFVTFEVESGDRMELRVSGKEYGLLAEGDVGRVTFQGTRYHGFERVASM